MEFVIYLIPEMTSNFKCMYKMTLVEMKELDGAIARTSRKEVYQTKCVSLGNTMVIFEEKEWVVAVMHRLL